MKMNKLCESFSGSSHSNNVNERTADAKKYENVSLLYVRKCMPTIQIQFISIQFHSFILSLSISFHIKPDFSMKLIFLNGINYAFLYERSKIKYIRENKFKNQ